jgi:GR25 family glycosyltransferase involved in LPS biosynthesis
MQEGDVKLNDFFDRIALVNLDRRTDRLEKFESQAKDLGISYVRYSAVDAEVCGITPQRACAASHRKILEDAISDGVQRLFVFEDDAGFDAEFNAKFSNIAGRVPDDWQMLYLGSWPYSIVDVKIEGIRRTFGNILTHAYGAKAEIFKQLIDASNQVQDPIDVAYALLHQKVTTYMAHPSIVTQFPDFSDIRKHQVDYRPNII